MNISRFRLRFVCLAAVGVALVACLGRDGTLQVSPLESPRFEPTDGLDDATPKPITVKSTPTPTAQPVMTTPTSASGDIRVMPITEQSKIAGARWSEDGRSMVYATWGEHRGVIEGWWEYEVSTGERHHIQPPFDLNLQVWTQLEASYVNETFIWFEGGLSPSGTRIVYNRLPLGHTYTPTPDEIYIAPYEIWTARSDGSDAVRLQSCYHIGWAIWLDQERKVIFSCGYEGPHDIGMASVDGNSFVDLTAVFGGLCTSHQMALSPDETKLAFPDSLGTLQIASLDDGEVQPIARWGYMPNWSPDSRRLYYQHLEEFEDHFADVRVYDLDSGADTLLIPSSKHTADGRGVSIPVGTFVVSPLENAAIFENRGLWLVMWSQ